MKCSAMALSSLVLRVRLASLPSAVLAVRVLSLHAQETAAIIPLPWPLWPFWSPKGRFLAFHSLDGNLSSGLIPSTAHLEVATVLRQGGRSCCVTGNWSPCLIQSRPLRMAPCCMGKIEEALDLLSKEAAAAVLQLIAAILMPTWGLRSKQAHAPRNGETRCFDLLPSALSALDLLGKEATPVVPQAIVAIMVPAGRVLPCTTRTTRAGPS